jgi:hypothetical protein
MSKWLRKSTLPKELSRKRKEAQQPNLPIERLIELSKDPDNMVRQYVAEHTNLPPEVLLEMSKDKTYGVRWNLAWNVNTPTEALNNVMKNHDMPSMIIPRYVAIHPNASPEMLTQLSKNTDWEVRFNVACNPSTPKEVLEKFVAEKPAANNKGIAAAAKATLSGDKHPERTLQYLLYED